MIIRELVPRQDNLGRFLATYYNFPKTKDDITYTEAFIDATNRFIKEELNTKDNESPIKALALAASYVAGVHDANRYIGVCLPSLRDEAVRIMTIFESCPEYTKFLNKHDLIPKIGKKAILLGIIKDAEKVKGLNLFDRVEDAKRWYQNKIPELPDNEAIDL